MSNTFTDSIGFVRDINNNPTITSPNACYDLKFYQTRETLMDTEEYSAFLKNAVSNFRHSRTYRHYKEFLYTNGIDHCQFFGNIHKDMVSGKLEMHHSIITIFDIAYIICEHVLNTVGSITTFQLAELIRQEHIEHRIPLCMLSLTPHQLYHNEDDFYISPNMVNLFKWDEFLYKYRYGISQDIAFKILFYLKRAIDEEGLSNDNKLLNLRNNIISWSNTGATVRF